MNTPSPGRVPAPPAALFLPSLLAVLLGIVCLTACRPPADQSRGVELVLSSPSPVPAMTFELRFEEAAIPAGLVGSTAPESPLVIKPALAGKFVWLSARNGVFTPAAPLQLETRYELSLRPGLTSADGRPLASTLRHTLTTPPFRLVGFTPNSASTNADSEPEIRLAFNAALDPHEASRFLQFTDDRGRSVEAVARAGMELDRGHFYGAYTEAFREGEAWAASTAPVHPREPAPDIDTSTNEVPHWLVVTPRHPLPVGRGWRLSLPAGLPAVDPRLRLREGAEVPIGAVTPFTLVSVTADHVINMPPVVRLAFSKAPAPGLATNFADSVGFEPAVEDLSGEVAGQELLLHGSFESRREYRIKARPGLPAAEAFVLAEGLDRTITVPAVSPRLYFPAFSTDQLASGRRSLPLMVVNTPRIHLRAKLLDPATAIHALRGYEGYYRYLRRGTRRAGSLSAWEPYEELDYNLIPGRTVYDEERQGSTEWDKAATLDLRWDTLLPGRKTGVVFLEAEREDDQLPTLGTQALIQLTDLGLSWKQSRAGFDLFVFSQRTGQPVPGATARVVGAENQTLHESLTDSAGLARLPANTNAAWIAAFLGDDFHALPVEGHPANLNGFDLPVAAGDGDGPEGATDRHRVLLFTDRDYYRPGETVFLKAIARDWGDGGLAIPAKLEGFVTLADARGETILQTNTSFNAEGSWSLAAPLPALIPRGHCTIELHLGEQTVTHEIQIHDFQPSAFEISLPAKPVLGPGEPIDLGLSARYYFGKPLSRARVKWTVEASDSPFQPEGFPGFHFETVELNGRSNRGATPPPVTGTGSLSATGEFQIKADLPAGPGPARPRVISVVAEVTDLNQQTLSRGGESIQHGAEFYLGLKGDAVAPAAGLELTLLAAAVGTDGHARTNPTSVHLTLQRVEWRNVLVRGAGRTARYRSEPSATPVLERDLLLAPAPEKGDPGQPIPGIVPAEPGQYLVELRAKDSGGRDVAASLLLYVVAPGKTSWDYRNDVAIKLKPDQEAYAPGQTAAVLIETPISGTALVTVEREAVRQCFTTRLQGNAPSIRIPLSAGDAPNVFVSVAIFRGAEDCPRAVKEPEYRIGYCQLTVADPRNRLAVKVTAPPAPCRPGQPVEIAVEARDARGAAAVGAEVTLYAVDEGILSLSAHTDPDPFGFFYAPRPLAVHTSISLPQLLTEDPEQFQFHNKGYLGGGGGRETPRRNFLACAFWHATLHTDAAGRLSARFPAPDSITRYRVVAVAQAGPAFGTGRASFEVSKPLLVEPALARFANVGDQHLARAVVHNQTGRAGDVIVSLELDEHARIATNHSPEPLHLAVAAHGSAAAEFAVDFTHAGAAKWVWHARFADAVEGGFSDSVESTLEVGYPAPALGEFIGGPVPPGGTNLLAGANPQLLAGEGTVTVRLANTRLVELAGTFASLLHYPYGCVEQASSSLLPWIVAKDNPALEALAGSGPAARDAAIRAGVARLFSMQTSSGGLGYWPGAKEPMPWGSAYAALVLALADHAGAEVPRDKLDRLLDYLDGRLRGLAATPTNAEEAPLALYALAVAGRPDPAYHELLHARRATLSPEDRALAALAVIAAEGPPAMARELLATNVTTRDYDEQRFACSAREKALLLLARTRLDPADPGLDRLARDLLGEQDQAHWGTTQGDAWGLLAFTEYARRAAGAGVPANGTLLWSGQTIPWHLDGASNLFTKVLTLTGRADATLRFDEAAGGSVYASLALEARPPTALQPRQDHGFGLERFYEKLDDEDRPVPATDLVVGDRVLVTLQLTARETARYVALDEAIPSLWEIVNPEFADQAARQRTPGSTGGTWWPDFHEIRRDRLLVFADWVPPGKHEWRYVARVRAAGTAVAPCAKVEAMYHPSRYGLAAAGTITSRPLP